MLEFVALEIWLAAIAGPCVACWTLGEIRGARRARRLIDINGASARPDDLLEPLPQTDNRSVLAERWQQGAAQTTRKVATGHQNRQQNRRKSDRLSELHAIPEPSPEYLEAMRERHEQRLRELERQVSADAMSPEVIERYQGSLAALARANAARIQEQAIILPEPRRSSAQMATSVEEPARKAAG